MTRKPLIFIAIATASAVGVVCWLQPPAADDSIQLISLERSADAVVIAEAVVRRGPRTITLRSLSADRQRVVIRPVDVRSFDSPQLAKAGQSDAIIGVINGGYFDANFKPVGLLKTAEGDISPMSREGLLSAVVVCGANQWPSLVLADTADVSALPAARQCGPILIGRTADATGKSKTAERSVIAFSERQVAFITTSAATFDDLRFALRQGGTFGIPDVIDAANLDGGPSSGMIDFAPPNPGGHEPRGRVTDVLVMERRP